MPVAEIIRAILDRDMPALRESFARFALDLQRYAMIDANAALFRRALGQELCSALFDDVSPMPVELCRSLGMPEGSTYARGADLAYSGIVIG